MIGAALLFGFVALGGLLAAMRPDLCARYFLAKWQRERLAGNMGALSWTGWILFGFSSCIVIVILIADVLRR